MAGKEIEPDLPRAVYFGGMIDGMRYAAGEDWVDKGEDEAPYIAKMIRSASIRFQIASNNPQADLFGLQTAQSTQAMLERGVELEVLAPEQAMGGLRESLGSQYDKTQVRIYSSGERQMRLEFMVVDGTHTLNKLPNNQGILHPGAILRWNDRIFARDRETVFREGLHTVGAVSDDELAQWKRKNPPIPNIFQRIRQVLFHR